MTQPVRPSELPVWATDATYSSGAFIGQPTKLNPAAGVKTQGFYPEQPGSSRHANWWQNLVHQWVTFFDAARDADATSRFRRMIQQWTSITLPSGNYPLSAHGFGANVGIVSILSGTDIVGYGEQGQLTQITCHTLAVSESGVSAFAQSPDGMTVIGTGASVNQTIWVSTNGGLSWTEVAYPDAAAAVSDIVVHYDRFTGHWFIIRANGSTAKVYRSTDNGSSWALRTSSLAYGGTSNATTLASAASGELYANTNLGSLNTTYVSTDGGATWSNAFAPTNRYVYSVVESKGDVYALGIDTSSGNKLYFAKRTAGTWIQNTIAVPGTSPPILFTRFSTTVGPWIVALAINSFAGSGSGYLMASCDGGVTWLFESLGLSTVTAARRHAPSPGGVHLNLHTVATAMFRILGEF